MGADQPQNSHEHHRLREGEEDLGGDEDARGERVAGDVFCYGGIGICRERVRGQGDESSSNAQDPGISCLLT